MATEQHPRHFRVERCTPGVDWTTDTYTYHRSIDKVNAAIARFFLGEGHYRLVRQRRSSFVIVSERNEPTMPERIAALPAESWERTTWVRRNVRYRRIDTIEQAAWQKAHQNIIDALGPPGTADQ